jgi:hypothetical protein
MYPLEELIRKWGRSELTVEQAIGQILLQLQWLDRRIGTPERGERDEVERGDRDRRGRPR